MMYRDRTFSLPKSHLMQWLADPNQDAPFEIRAALISSLYGTLPIFIGGVANTVLVAGVIAARRPEPAFLAWFAFEVLLLLIRTSLIVIAYKAAREGRETPTDLYLALALVWAASVGVGGFISILSGDWVIAALACLSSAAMMGGICFRNFAAPRLATAMIVLSFGPICLGAILSGEPIMLLTALQIPFYLYAMSKAVYRLCGMLVSTMRSERDSDHQARHDMLTGLPNRRFLTETAEASAALPMVMALVDIDRFKIVNDTYGHQIGDVVLQTIGRIMTTHLATFGMVGRFGGEEFALIAPDASTQQVVVALQGLLKEVERTTILAGGQRIHVTLSAGVAYREPGEELEQVYSDADTSLYLAKRSGRNRIEVAEWSRNASAYDGRNIRSLRQ
ncbi:GGDEF domain-containing protein [Microvirga sp. ACRRW]|uniref:GGDEF domain-containing protein n=1 Tax=Microvirga sp. ACRRW TaxID=2918205 RepID=UPI001EF5F1CD|nr:GGDEF domain-containing protein [Microvirga sp. ACRRW]MCG7392168.1 GGDEF domain-containing protein [Microvirga sp. ACRRW]